VWGLYGAGVSRVVNAFVGGDGSGRMLDYKLTLCVYLQVYAFGGYDHENDFATSNSIEEFDPATNQWRELDKKLGRARYVCFSSSSRMCHSVIWDDQYGKIPGMCRSAYSYNTPYRI